MSNKKIVKFGNDLVFVLPKEIVDRFGLKSNDEIIWESTDTGVKLFFLGRQPAEQIEIARQIMQKRRVALAKLSK